jgi:hypothetical protein
LVTTFSLWLGVVAVGIYFLSAYANTPGGAGSPPTNWLAATVASRDPGRPNLMVFIHPRCPCSRATIGELAELMAHCQNRVNATVFFLKPPGAATNWTATDLWRDAARIPGVVVQIDHEGRAARRFHIETSGDAILYNTRGRLLFHGGITQARGHFGDNPGLDSLESLILGKQAPLNTSPVFGCSLFDCKSKVSP